MVLVMGESDRLGELAFRAILRLGMRKDELNGGGRGGGARVTQLGLWNHQEPHLTAILQSEPANLHQNVTRVRDWRLDIHSAPSRRDVLAGLSGSLAGRGGCLRGAARRAPKSKQRRRVGPEPSLPVMLRWISPSSGRRLRLGFGIALGGAGRRPKFIPHSGGFGSGT